MDINMTLHELREAFAEMRRIGEDPTFAGQQRLVEDMVGHALMAAEKFEALDGWMSGGGFAPDAWKETEDHR